MRRGFSLARIFQLLHLRRQNYLGVLPKIWRPPLNSTKLNQATGHDVQPPRTIATSFLKVANIKIFASDKNFSSPAVSTITTAKLPQFIEQWKSITSDPAVLEIVTGVNIPFRCVPVQTSPQVTKTLPESFQILEQEVQSLLAKGAICEVPFTQDGFYSRLFLVPKKDGSMRPVVDLSPLNRFIKTPHFKMEHLTTVQSLLKQGHNLTKLDLKDAYLSGAIHPQSQKYLRFLWQKKAYQFRALPSGLNIAPLVFTRLMKPVAGFLRKRGIRLVLYLDDMLIIGSTPQETRQFTQMAMDLLESLGFVINKEKSILTPSRLITFLGFTINSMRMLFTLPQEKVQKLLTLCRQIRSGLEVLLRTLAQLLLESYRPAVWKAPLHFRHVQALLIRGLAESNHNYTTQVPLTLQAKGELTWWLQNLAKVNGSPIIHPTPDLTIFTDASLTGWGAVCGNSQTNGKWSATEKRLHINVLELKGAMLEIQSLMKNQHSKIISLSMDNSTAVAYINHKGGTRSPELLNVTLQLWNWCIQSDLYIIARHVPGKTNVTAVASQENSRTTATG